VTASEPAIEVRSLTVRFPGQDLPALQDISFRVPRGQIAIVIGPNGSGKSTLLRAILGLVASTGEVRVFGGAVRDSLQRIGYVPQRLLFDPTLPLTVREVLEMPRRRAGHDGMPFAIATMHLQPFLDRPLGHLSGGQLQRVLIGRALVTRPELLLLDEPEAGVDTTGETRLYDELAALATESGLTALICSHELELVARYADQVICLNRNLICHGSPAAVLTEENLRRLYAGAVSIHRHEASGPIE
jgi:ABC-type Mn2+/Zn2+ transport system ATPase subunit